VRDDDGLRAQGQAPFDVLRVQVEGRRVDLGHDRRSPGDGHGVQQRRADETRDHDLVARADPHGGEGQVQGRRARAHAHGMRHSDESGEFPLEGLNLRAFGDLAGGDDRSRRLRLFVAQSGPRVGNE